MAKFTVHYQLRKGSMTTSGTKTVECESEHTAIRIAEDELKSRNPGYEFFVKKIDKK